VRDTESQPANLIVLQPIARPFHLDQPVAAEEAWTKRSAPLDASSIQGMGEVRTVYSPH
jgi:hypothetical protein